MKFDVLVSAVQHTHTALQQSAVKAINKHLTIRNWPIGFYIIEFEQKGEDKAAYGEKLLANLSDALSDKGVSNVNERELRRYRTFYLIYPGLGAAFFKENIRGTLSPVFRLSRNFGAASCGHD